MIRWMYSGNDSQGIMPGDTPVVQKMLWAYSGVHFVFGSSQAHGHRVYRLRREILHNFMSKLDRNGSLGPSLELSEIVFSNIPVDFPHNK